MKSLKSLLKNKTFLIATTCSTTALIASSFFWIPELTKDKAKTEDQPKTELEILKNKEKEYQLKITTFNPKNYTLPKSNLANAVEHGGCKFGFGGDMPKLYPGMFSEPLYELDAEKIQTEEAGEYGYAPYVNSYTVIGDILFRKPLDLFDRKIITTDELTRNYSDNRIVIGNKSFKNSYRTMQSKFGFPQSYLVQQTGEVATFAAFNDDCNKNVGIKNLTFMKVDLSGLPISSLLSTTYQTNLYHGINGLYNYTRKSPDFVSPSFLEWVQSNNRAYLNIVNDPKLMKFPKNSYLYVIKSYENRDESVSIDFKSKPIDLTLDQWKLEVSKVSKVPLSEITFVEEQFKEFKIIKVARVKDMAQLSPIALAIKDGKKYAANWEIPDKFEIQGNEPDRHRMVFMNLQALSAALTVFKSHYQGEQLDIGTDKEGMDEKVASLKEQKDDKVDKLESLKMADLK